MSPSVSPQAETITLSTAIELFASGNFEEALGQTEQLLLARPDAPLCLNLAAACAKQLGATREAWIWWRKTIVAQPAFSDPHYNLGVLYAELGRHAEAEAAYWRGLVCDPNLADAQNNLGLLLVELDRDSEAAAAYRAALEIDPARRDTWCNLGVVLLKLHHVAEAEAAYRRALAVDPAFAQAYNNLGIVLAGQRRDKEAELAYRSGLTHGPDLEEIRNNLGAFLMDGRRFVEAEAAYRQALALRPDYADANNSMGNILRVHGRYGEAVTAYRRALALCPAAGQPLGHIPRVRRQVCSWVGLDQEDAALKRYLATGKPGDLSPFSIHVVDGITATEQREAGRLWAEGKLKATLDRSPVVAPGADYGHDRLRIGYLSADFHEHATVYLLAGVLESHRQETFSIHAYSSGPNIRDSARQRIESSCEVFRDIATLSDEAAACLIAADEIDILVDLKGYTQDSRPGIVASRPAPVIVNWLGYPGSMGHPRLADYLIGDPIVTPLAHGSDFSETLVLMPHSYQPNDRKRVVGAKPTRAEAGLPESGFIFCCFNVTAKLCPGIFALWSSLLRAVPDSILWLLQPTNEAGANLRREAEQRGVNQNRLIFAPKQPLSQHLGRLQLADLALDTFPYTSHTTGSDALWAGVPLVTRIGDTFASRVAASLLHAVKLPELVTESPDEYFNLAFQLATQPARLADLRTRLAANRLSAPLFDTKGFTSDLERLYGAIWMQHRQGRYDPIMLSSAGQ